MSIRVILAADDQPLVRAGLRILIEQTPGIDVAAEAATRAEAVQLARDTGADVVVMDIRMPGTDGIEATRLITAGGMPARVLVLTTFDDDDYVYGALRAGVSGFLVKDMALDDILTAIRVAAAGDAIIAPGVTRRLIGQFTSQPRPGRRANELTGITDREREVLRLVGLGMSNAEIAAALYITAGTAKTHVSRLLAKLGARDRVHPVIDHRTTPAKPTPRPGWELLAGQVNQRRYEALRAYLYEGRSLHEAADASGYTRDAVASLVRDLRAGKLTVFAPPGTPGRKSAPKRDAARGRVIELRREGLPVYEISTRLGQEGTPLGHTAVSDILREEGFGRLLRDPAPEASISLATSGRDTRLAGLIDFTALPPRAHTTMAGLLLAIPDLAALSLPALTEAAGYPGTRVIPAISWLLSLLALKLTATRRVSHVDDLLTDPAPALLAGLSILPKKTALTDYSYRLSHDHQLRFMAALDKQMIAVGLASADQAIFDLDFHAVMHWAAILRLRSTTSPRAPSAPAR